MIKETPQCQADQIRQLKRRLTTTDSSFFFFTADAIVRASGRKSKQKCAGSARQSIPQPPSANQTRCQKALLAALPGRQPDRLIMFAAFAAQCCSSITA